MAYQRRILSDGTPIALGTSASVTTVGVTSSTLDTRNYRDVEFFVKVTSKGSATLITLSIEFSSIDGAAEDWADLNSESISSGLAPQNNYQAEFDLSSFSGAFTIAASVPTRGRYMRLQVVPDDTISGVTITAIRRA